MNDLENAKTIAIWGMGIEGRAAQEWLQHHFPDKKLLLLDDDPHQGFLTGEDLTKALHQADVIVKSPGISLYDQNIPARTPVTSLINLWFSQKRKGKTICITGTKGKSTVSSLLFHVLSELHQKSILIGNIGTPLTEAGKEDYDFYIIEVSSYQAANFSGTCDVAAITNLYEDHLTWHKNVRQYHHDKINLLEHSEHQFLTKQSFDVLQSYKNTQYTPPVQNLIDSLNNEYLSRPHNLDNVGLVMNIAMHLGFDKKDIIHAVEGFKGLPHRQCVIGTQNSITYVDDSISTTPQSTIACINVFKENPLTLIIGGVDRGINYIPLINAMQESNIHYAVFLGEAGKRIYDEYNNPNSYLANTMEDAIDKAQEKTESGGYIILSPTAASHDEFKNFKERGNYFAKKVGL